MKCDFSLFSSSRRSEEEEKMAEKKRWIAMYTKHIKQKRKVYHDGFLDLQIARRKVFLQSVLAIVRLNPLFDFGYGGNLIFTRNPLYDLDLAHFQLNWRVRFLVFRILNYQLFPETPSLSVNLF